MSLGPFWIFDKPATPAELDVESSEDVDSYTGATVDIVSPIGGVKASPAATLDGDQIAFTFPAELDAVGIWKVVPRLVGAERSTVRLPAVEFVVQEDTGWHTLDSARQAWSSAPSEDAQLYRLLDVARIQCMQYARPLTGKPPANYQQAQLMQTRAIWQASRANVNDQLGGEGFQVTVFPMDWTVKQMLRPKRIGRPR